MTLTVNIVLDTINDYGSSELWEICRYYAGVSYLKMGDNENAIDYLGDFSRR